MKTIRSNHNNLLNYFIHDHQDLSPAYVRSCERFFDSICWPNYYGGTNTNGKIYKLNKPQAPSAKLQAPRRGATYCRSDKMPLDTILLDN